MCVQRLIPQRSGQTTGPFTGMVSVAGLDLETDLAVEWAYCSVMSCCHPNAAIGALYLERFSELDRQIADRIGAIKTTE